jgi:molecular chaperone DnaJ
MPVESRSYYVVLGVPRDESSAGIRAAYRDLVTRYHPDRAGPRATPLFQEVVEAYRVLSDPRARASYDAGLDHTRRSVPPGGSIVTGPVVSGGLVPERIHLMRDFVAGLPTAEEVLARVRRNFASVAPPRRDRMSPLDLEVILSAEQAATGGILELAVPVFHPCRVCRGTGQAWPMRCSVCGGEGIAEEEEAVRIAVRPGVASGTLLEMPLRGLGIHNLYLRTRVRVAGDSE